MLRLITLLHEAAGEELVLPVTPPSYTWRKAAAIETVRLDQIGEINLSAGGAMGECILEDVLLPARQYPFCNAGAVADPEYYLSALRAWRDQGAVLRFIVSGTGVNESVLIEELAHGEKDGTNDVVCTITLREWRKPEAAVLSVSVPEAQTDRDTQTGASYEKTYTVVSGDCLWNIAKKFYGSGTDYKRIAAANPFITNPNLIYPGQVLTIPAADDLPAAKADSESVALAGQIQTTWDPVSQTWTFSA